MVTLRIFITLAAALCLTTLPVTAQEPEPADTAEAEAEDPLDGLRNTNTIRFVMKNGRLYDGDTLAEIFPTERPGPTYWWQETLPSGGLPGAGN